MLLADAKATALDEQASAEVRCAALRVVAYAPREPDPDGLRDQQAARRQYLRLFESQTPSDIQVAAVPVLLREFDADVAHDMVRQWPTLLPAVRAAIIDQSLAGLDSTRWLLQELKSETLTIRDIDAARREPLLRHRDPQIAAAAAELFQDDLSTDRAALIERYRTATDEPSAARGQPLFEKHCAVCHVGTPDAPALGPDLRSLSDRSPQTLLPAILDPSRAVEPKYLAYEIETKAGELVYGLIAGASGTTLRIRQSDGNTRE